MEEYTHFFVPMPVKKQNTNYGLLIMGEIEAGIELIPIQLIPGAYVN